jgi:hypothetical protein
MKFVLMTICLIRIALAQPVDPSKLHAPVAPVSIFKSTCFSDVCLGDDLNKIGGLKITWLSEATRNTRYHPLNPQNVRDAQKAFRGLTDADYKVLAGSIYFSGTSDENINIILPPIVHIEINDATLPILKKATTCTATLPVHGIFKSESGHYTSVLLLSDNGRLRVVKAARRWMPNFPATATDAQKDQMANQQLGELSQQINDAYGAFWHADGGTVNRTTNFSARSKDAVAYLDTRDMAHPVMTFYTATFAAFAKSDSPWDAAIAGYERALANTPGCAVATPTLKIN